MGLIKYSIGSATPVTLADPLPPLPEIRIGGVVLIEGRAPIWRYAMALRKLQGSPAAAIAVYDPKIGAIIVSTCTPDFADGQVIEIAEGQL